MAGINKKIIFEKATLSKIKVVFNILKKLMKFIIIVKVIYIFLSFFL